MKEKIKERYGRGGELLNLSYLGKGVDLQKGLWKE